ncbi:MAG: hypothetical protein K0Q79_3005 [Flavipsychrobacter sp.]|jgi:hypothetical protein|nr:hypothetical protein [Flavipsychrobacter sp.]
MKTNWMAIGIATASAAALYYPALKLYQYIMKRAKSKEKEPGMVKAFSPAYRGKNKAHNRQAHNGHTDMGHA